MDLPGYGFARGDTSELSDIARGYFERATERSAAALLLVDARHPGLKSDLDAWAWLRSSVDRVGVVATKIDKLSRAERLRVMATNEAVFEHPVTPVSADTGEGLEELWKLIDQLTTSA